MHHIALVVNECNDVSYKLYKSLGFKDTGVVITKHRVKQRLLQNVRLKHYNQSNN